MKLPNDIASCHRIILEQQKQFEERIKKMQDQIQAQMDVINMLQARVLELEAQVKKNSQNSNKPPSSDGLRKKNIRPAFPRKRGNKTGGQQGHTGKTLEQSDQVDFYQPLLPDHCICGKVLDIAQSQIIEKRQVFDIPDPRLEVTEYQKRRCACGHCGYVNEGEFPKGVNAYVQYGVGVKSLVVLLNVAFQLPVKKTKTLFADLFGYAINEKTIIEATQKCYDHLEQSEKVVKQSLLKKLVVHFDETGVRVLGKLHWLHTACDKLFTHIFVHAKRGKIALRDVDSILPSFKNRAIHDCWKSYFDFINCLHGICGAHLLRELTALEENQIQWAKWMKRYLITIYLMSDKGKNKLTEPQQQKALVLYQKIWDYANEIEPPPKKSTSGRGRPKATKGRNLLTRLKEHQSAILAFAFHEEVPFTNNQAERDIRPAKTKQKVSGCFRTIQGAQIYARILGFVSTTRKHQFSIFNELKATLEGENFLTRNNPS